MTQMDTPSVNHFRSLQINNNGVRIFEDSNGFCKVDKLFSTFTLLVEPKRATWRRAMHFGQMAM